MNEFSSSELIGYVDSDYVGDLDKRSIYSYFFLLGKNLLNRSCNMLWFLLQKINAQLNVKNYESITSKTMKVCKGDQSKHNPRHENSNTFKSHKHS